VGALFGKKSSTWQVGAALNPQGKMRVSRLLYWKESNTCMAPHEHIQTWKEFGASMPLLWRELSVVSAALMKTCAALFLKERIT